MLLSLFIGSVSSFELKHQETVSGNTDADIEASFDLVLAKDENIDTTEFIVEVSAKNWYVSVSDDFKVNVVRKASNIKMSSISLKNVEGKKLAALLKSVKYFTSFASEDSVTVEVAVANNAATKKTGTVKITTVVKEVEEDILTQVFTWIAIILCFIMSALYSGIDLGLLSIDPNTISFLMASENEHDRKMGKAFKLVHRDDNWLICTVLAGNVLVNAANSILMSGMTSAVSGMLISTFCISIFCEISPQALFFRFRIPLSYYTLWYTWFSIVILSPIAWPLSRVLNWVLGDEGIHIYSQKELIGFLDLKGDLDTEQGIVRGALQLSNIQIKDHCSPLSFVVHPEEKIDQDLISRIIASGFSRIPVLDWDGQPRWVIPVRMLLVIPRDGSYTAGDVAPLLNERHLVLNEDLEMLLALRHFQSRGASFAFVRQTVETGDDRDATLRVTGVVTVEDIIEKMIGHEIFDETDNKKDPEETKELFRLLSQEDIGPSQNSFRVAQGTVLTPGMIVLTGEVQVILDQEQKLFANIQAPFTVPENLKSVVISGAAFVSLPE